MSLKYIILIKNDYRGVEIVYFPYTKGTSSTQLRQLIADEIGEEK
jgi:hypothetical protein